MKNYWCRNCFKDPTCLHDFFSALQTLHEFFFHIQANLARFTINVFSQRCLPGLSEFFKIVSIPS